jgi:quinol monooxygenase YgiN
MAVSVLVIFQAKPGSLSQLLSGLSFPPEAMKGVPGSLGSRRLFTEAGQPDRLTEISEWESAEHHQQFMAQAQKSGAFDQLNSLLAGYPETRYLTPA